MCVNYRPPSATGENCSFLTSFDSPRSVSLKVPTVEAKRRFRLWGRQDEEEPSVGAVIGAPFNVQHVTHVKPDSHSSTGAHETIIILRTALPTAIYFYDINISIPVYA